MTFNRIDPNNFVPRESKKKTDAYQVVIKWNPKMLAEFKVEYQKAYEADEQSFVFKDNEFITGYAKYLIEYLEAQWDAS